MNNCKVFLFSRGCCAGKNTLYYLKPISDRPILSLGSDLGVMHSHSILALAKSQSTRIIHDWRGRCAGTGRVKWTGSMKERTNGHGSSCGVEMLFNGPQSQWDIKLMTDSSLGCITALSSRPSKFSRVLEGILNKNSQSFHNCQLTFFPAACIQMFTLMHTLYSETDMHMHIYSAFHPPEHIHTGNKNMKTFRPKSLIFS